MPELTNEERGTAVLDPTPKRPVKHEEIPGEKETRDRGIAAARSTVEAPHSTDDAHP